MLNKNSSQKKQTAENKNAISDLSSLEGDDQDVDLLNPESRKFVNDKEYLKFVTIQMWWNFVAGFLIGIYAVLLALMGSFNATPYLELDCETGVKNPSIWEAGNTFSEIYLTMHPSLIIVSATMDYFIYFSIPFRLNRILKTQKEIDVEAKQKLDQIQNKDKDKIIGCCCCKYTLKAKK